MSIEEHPEDCKYRQPGVPMILYIWSSNDLVKLHAYYFTKHIKHRIFPKCSRNYQYSCCNVTAMKILDNMQISIETY